MWGSIASWAARKGVTAFWNVWKWKLVALVAAAVIGYVGVLKYQLNSARADVKTAKAELTLANGAIDQLKTANENFAAAVALRDKAAEQLKKDAENARRNAERVQRELASRRAHDREAPDCAALLDRALAVCPDVERRLRERAAALSHD